MQEVEKLCGLQCTAQEIADWFHVSVDTLDRRMREERHVGFAEFFATYRTSGKIALRRTMFRLAESNAAMCIFLAKNHLGMVDKIETDITTKGQSLNDLTDAELVGIIQGGRSGGTATPAQSA
jgi:ribosomal protein S19E (S16A)